MNENVALTNMYLGIATLAAAELPVERMAVALNNRDQEDEHSCFSDNTHRDIIQNLQGIVNVYHGKYRDIEGASLADL
jgi:putative iron-regulated protein